MKAICETVTTVASSQDAEKIIEELTKRKLVACIQQIPITSTYYWEGKWQVDPEIELKLKHSLRSKDAVLELLKEIHPYDTPQIITWTVDASDDYAKWVNETCE